MQTGGEVATDIALDIRSCGSFARTNAVCRTGGGNPLFLFYLSRRVGVHAAPEMVFELLAGAMQPHANVHFGQAEFFGRFGG
jgi:hypothetical protein